MSRRGTLLELGFSELFTLARLIPFGTDFYVITPTGERGNNFINSTQHSRRGQFLTNLFLPSWHLAGTHNLKIGSDLDRMDYSQGINRTGYDLYGVNSNLLRSVTFEGSGTLSRPSLSASSYLTDHWQARRNLFFELGVREDWDEILRRWLWSPRASFSYAPFDWATREYRADLPCFTIPPLSSYSPGRSTNTLSPKYTPLTARCCYLTRYLTTRSRMSI